MVSVAWSTAIAKGLDPTGGFEASVTVPGVWPHPVVFAASQVAPSIAYTLLPRNGCGLNWSMLKTFDA
jgi:hypothetical protein